ncbi:glutaredoxin family protein [Piscinibacter gummiphilus]|uniref:Glutaredoxin family protein n=1 Tax=Piscinibacter gummiphilus TaxID=946333 RepID=A0ABZ0CTJ6_9BURK|nr:glutaredoxin family protein [Piscinibacter gummiphilus]WOB06431.1 glutaredoxin family protein [Piscinibacter gummiphilus]
MNARHRAIHTLAASVAALSAGVLLLSAAPAFALYKVVGPDGKITYTDRPDVGTDKKVQSVNTRGGGGADDASLPFELRQIALRFPVVLYVAADCQPCDEARQFLRGRGIPASEKLVTTPEDGQALQRLTGGSTLPVMTVGAQIVRGWQREQWASYIDAAGYPKDSKLPANFPQGKPEPLTEARPAPAPAAPQPAPAAPPAPAPAPAPAPGTIRF